MNSRRLTLHEREDPELHLWGDLGAAQDACETASKQGGKPKLNNQKGREPVCHSNNVFCIAAHLTFNVTITSTLETCSSNPLCITLLQSDVFHRINILIVRPSACVYLFKHASFDHCRYNSTAEAARSSKRAGNIRYQFQRPNHQPTRGAMQGSISAKRVNQALTCVSRRWPACHASCA